MDNHAIMFNHDRGLGDNFIDIVHTLAITRDQVGWTAGGKGIYYRQSYNKTIAEDFDTPNKEVLKYALIELDKLIAASCNKRRNDQYNIMVLNRRI